MTCVATISFVVSRVIFGLNDGSDTVSVAGVLISQSTEKN